MAFSHSMWLNRRSIVFMMAFLWNVEAMSADDCSAGGGTNAGSVNDFASSINPRFSGAIGQCVPFNKCCDAKKQLPFLGLVDERTGNPIVDIRGGGNNKCKGKLDLCCRCVDDGPTSTTNETHNPEPSKTMCGKRNADGVQIRVTGFKEGQTQQGEFPWMVAVLAKATELRAGGSLVHPRVVLTAGHKVYQKTPDSLEVRIGDWDIDNRIESIAPQDIDVSKILYHDNFNRTQHFYNVAILILKAEAKYGETVAPVCLPDPGQKFNGKDCFVTGWGKDKFGDNEKYPSIMKMVSVPTVNHSKCQTLLRDIKNTTTGESRLGTGFVLHSSFNCAGGHTEDACTGDGGSPLVCPGANNQLFQVGVVSWGIGCGIEGNPGVYGSVPESMDWITRKLEEEIGIVIDRNLG